MRRFLTLLPALLAAQPAVANEPPQTVAFAITSAAPSREPVLVTTTKGRRLVLEVRADRPVVVHVHGLGVELVAEPHKPGSANVVAGVTGRFPVNVHDASEGKAARGHHRAPFAYIEVHPK